MSSTFNPVVYIPSNLDIEKHISQFPPVEIPTFCMDKLKYIVGLINSIPSNNRLLFAPDSFIPLNVAKLKNHIKDYRLYLDYLLRTHILESDNFYLPGSKSYGYRFTDIYNTMLIPVSIHQYTLRKLVQDNSQSKFKKDESVYSSLSQWFNPALQIDFSYAYDFLADQFHKTKVDIGDYKARRKFYLNRLSVDRFHNQDFYFHKDENVGRLHTNLTNMKSGLRNFITYNSHPLVSIDIRNSQPFLCNTFLNENFYSFSGKPKNCTKSSNIYFTYSESTLKMSEILKEYSFYNINTTIRLSEIFSLLMRGKYELPLAAAELQRYMDLTASGNIYQYIQSEYKAQTGIEIPLGKKLKEVVFTVMFTDNRFIGQKEAEPKRVFKSLFPFMYYLFSLIKKGDSSTLPRLLQSIEAKIILDRVCLRISTENPYLPIYTIHDSVVCPVGYEYYIASVIKEEMVNAIGLCPSLKYEYWSPDALLAY